MHPDKIGPYHIDRKIGSGGMGNVYHGTHEGSGDEVAVKVLPASIAREEGFVHRFSREIDALRKVSSPNIVQIFLDGQSDDGSYYFSMEFVDGETLTSMVSRRKRIPWQEVVEISQQICTALKAAHDAGIVHRDIKPSNLMVTKDGTVKLADFGVAHVFAATRLTRTGGVVGTAEYMSPEQARGQRATKLSDLYSLGAVMYVMLTGRPPFTGRTAAEILQKHQFGQFDRLSHFVPDLPRELEEFVCRLLEKRPEKRLPDAFVVMRQLTNIRSRIEYAQNADAETIKPQQANAGRTAGLGSERTLNPEADDRQMTRGPATMVRDAIREDLDQQLKKSPLAKFFDNTFVLITLLALVLVAGYYLSKKSEPTPQERLEEAKAAFEGRPGRGWTRARDDILKPLLDEDALPEQRTEIESLVRRADQFEFTDGMQTGSYSDGTADSEVHRLIAHAFERYAEGDVALAIEQLTAVRALLTENDGFLKDFVDERLSSWDEGQWITGRRTLLRSVATEARQAITEKSDTTVVAERLRAAISLYESDRSVTAEVAECQSLLEQLQGTQRAETEPDKK